MSNKTMNGSIEGPPQGNPESSASVGMGQVVAELLAACQSLPLVVHPDGAPIDALDWLRSHSEAVRQRLEQHGAILFRGFSIGTVDDFHRFASGDGELLEYTERTSPRSRVGDRIYTSTDYPASQQILPHNEHSYSQVFPGRLAFWCHVPPDNGGETPLVDTRKVYSRIDSDVRDKLERLGWMYVRNFDDRIGLPWQQVFQTTDKRVVETYCGQSKIEYQWKSNNRLRTWQVRPAVIRHPTTGELSWFNHVAFFHISSLPTEIQAAIRHEYDADDLPNNTYFGDGSSIADDAIAHISDVYRQEMVSFRWRKGDVLVVDNISVAHARNPFVGPRRILVALSHPVARTL